MTITSGAYSNQLLRTHTIRLESEDHSRGVFLYYDEEDDKFKTTFVNPDPSAIPNINHSVSIYQT